MYPDRDTIPQLLPAPDVLLRLLQEKSKYITKHLMSGPSGNIRTLRNKKSVYCFLWDLSVSACYWMRLLFPFFYRSIGGDSILNELLKLVVPSTDERYESISTLSIIQACK